MFIELFLSIFVCFIPMITGFLFFALKLKIKPLHLLLAIVLGFVAIIPSSLIQYFIPKNIFFSNYPVLHSLLTSLLIYGFLEEFFKAAFIIPLPKKNYSILSFFCLSLMLGLSLCCFESVVYFLDNLQLARNREAQFMYSLIFTRLFTSDIIHTACAGLCGLFIYSCLTKSPKISIFLTAILLHGLYDFFAGFKNGLHWFFIPVLILSVLECRIKYKSLISDDDFGDPQFNE